MFGKKGPSDSSKLDEPIDAVLSSMKTFGPDDAEYPPLLAHLEKLTTLKASLRRPRVSLDTVMLVTGNLLGILIIVAYEQKHVMTSKGLNFVMKPK